jgi:hypothetical protein
VTDNDRGRPGSAERPRISSTATTTDLATDHVQAPDQRSNCGAHGALSLGGGRLANGG